MYRHCYIRSALFYSIAELRITFIQDAYAGRGTPVGATSMTRKIAFIERCVVQRMPVQSALLKFTDRFQISGFLGPLPLVSVATNILDSSETI